VWDATVGRPRLRVLVAVLLFCGLRVSEAVAVQVRDVQEQQGARVLRVTGKGGLPRTAVLPAVAVVAVTEWLQLRGEQPGPLLCTSTGRALDVRAAHRESRALGARAGVRGLHPHTLRHTFATSAVDSGVGVLHLATALGHKSPSTTMRYIRGRDVITTSPVHAVAAAILSAPPAAP
jgi:integrase